MGFLSVIWNATEYLCYVSIIMYVAFCFGLDRLLGLRKNNRNKNDESNEDNVEDDLLTRAVAMLGGLLNNIDTGDGKKKKSVPASRKRTTKE